MKRLRWEEGGYICRSVPGLLLKLYTTPEGKWAWMAISDPDFTVLAEGVTRSTKSSEAAARAVKKWLNQRSK